MYRIILLSLILILSQALAQSDNSKMFLFKTVLFPEGKLFPSNFSDPFEAKIGTQYCLDDKRLILNIGASKDIIFNRLNFYNSISFGFEFFSWTLLDRETQFRFPVIATDYFFGGYFVFFHKGKSIDWANRLRLSHISAHLSDGSFDKDQNQWLNNQLPFTYSREFVQWTSSFIYKNLRLYFDLIYLFHSIPSMKNNTIFGTGSETILVNFPGLKTSIYSGFDLKFQKILGDKFEVNKNFSTGFIIGNLNYTHLRIAYQFYSGYHFHGMFFDKKFKQSFINLSLVI